MDSPPTTTTTTPSAEQAPAFPPPPPPELLDPVCVCGHLRSSHTHQASGVLPPQVLGCQIPGCACGPGCIHEGFVDAAQGGELPVSSDTVIELAPGVALVREPLGRTTITVGGYVLPHVTVIMDPELGTPPPVPQSIHLLVDDRMAMYVPTRDAGPWLRAIAELMAVSAGLTCFGEQGRDQRTALFTQRYPDLWAPKPSADPDPGPGGRPAGSPHPDYRASASLAYDNLAGEVDELHTRARRITGMDP